MVNRPLAELRSGGENANGAVAPGKLHGWPLPLGNPEPLSPSTDSSQAAYSCLGMETRVALTSPLKPPEDPSRRLWPHSAVLACCRRPGPPPAAALASCWAIMATGAQKNGSRVFTGCSRSAWIQASVNTLGRGRALARLDELP